VVWFDWCIIQAIQAERRKGMAVGALLRLAKLLVFVWSLNSSPLSTLFWPGFCACMLWFVHACMLEVKASKQSVGTVLCFTVCLGTWVVVACSM
jgi:hypothetical protein